MKLKTLLPVLCVLVAWYAQRDDVSALIEKQRFNPGSMLWYEQPAKEWEEALPVGNGRLGAMVFGKHGEERIQLNEETYWSGGPYSTVVKGGAQVLPQIQKLLFEGKPLEAIPGGTTAVTTQPYPGLG